jgi:hypothetical protein
MAAIVGVVAAAGALVWVVWRSPHRSDLSTFWAFAAAVVVPVASLVIYLTKVRPAGDAGQGRPLNELADSLAAAVTEQWTRAALERRLLQPEPIPVPWERSSRPLAGPVSAAVESRQFAPLPGLSPAAAGQLRGGRLQDLHAVYGGLGSGRLVIIGEPGSGKTGAAVLLVLAALEHRQEVPSPDRQLVPVPVLFTMHGWDPHTQQIGDWLAARLQETYPLFVGKSGRAEAAELGKAGRIAVILDGLDEIAEELRPIALRALSQQAGVRVVVLTRSFEMEAVARQAFLEGAAALELHAVDAATAADYLTRVQLDPPPHGWSDLTGRLRREPGSAIAKALSNPLTLTLVRDTYRSGDDIRELLDFCDAVGDVSGEDIQDHLLDRVLPAAYAPAPGAAPPRLNRLSLMTGLGYALLGGLFGGLVFGLVYGPAVGRLMGLVAAVAGGLAGIVAAGLSRSAADETSPLTPPASWRRDHAFGLVLGLTLGAGLGLGLGLGFAAGHVAAFALLFVDGLGFGLVWGLSVPMTWTASLAFAQLAIRWHTPARLLRFLEDARQRDVLRTVGPIYQFRHARLQDRLAGRPGLDGPP